MYEVYLNGKLFCTITGGDENSVNRDDRYFIFKDVNDQMHAVYLGANDSLQIHELDEDQIQLRKLQEATKNA